MLIKIPIDQIAYMAVVGVSFVPALSFIACSVAALREKLGPGGVGEESVSKRLTAAGVTHLDDFYLRRRDGMLVQIDHAAKFAGGIGILETKNWRGHFVAPADAVSGPWSREVENDEPAVAFDGANPFVQNEGHVRAVREVVGEQAPVWNIVAMVHPEGGVSLDDPKTSDDKMVAAYLAARGGLAFPGVEFPAAWDEDEIDVMVDTLKNRASQFDVDRAWNALVKSAQRGDAIKKEHLIQVDADISGDRNQPSKMAASLTLLASGLAAGLVAAAFWVFQWGYIDLPL